MMRNSLKILSVLIAGLALGMASCSNDKHGDATPIPILRLDRAVARFATADSATRAALVDSFADEAVIYGQMMGLGEVEPDTAMLVLSDTRMVQVFQPDVEERLPSLDSVESVLGNALPRLASKLPRARVSEVVGIVSPAPHKIVVADDSLVYIALNHYLGSDYPGYGHMPAYEVAQKRPERIPFDVAEAVAAVNYPIADDVPLMLVNRMLYEGALVNAVVESIDGANVWSVMGYDPDERHWLENNEKAAWNALIAKDLLYSTSEAEASRLLRPAPRSFIVAADAPARVGRYLGYKIVEAYKKTHPDVTAETLLSPKFYMDNRSLVESKYSPK